MGSSQIGRNHFHPILWVCCWSSSVKGLVCVQRGVASSSNLGLPRIPQMQIVRILFPVEMLTKEFSPSKLLLSNWWLCIWSIFASLHLFLSSDSRLSVPWEDDCLGFIRNPLRARWAPISSSQKPNLFSQSSSLRQRWGRFCFRKLDWVARPSTAIMFVANLISIPSKRWRFSLSTSSQ